MPRNGTVQVKDIPKEVLLGLITLAESWGVLQKEFEDNNKTMYKTCDSAKESLESFKQECSKENLSFRAKHNLLSIGYFLAYGNEEALGMCPEKYPR